MSRRSRDSYYHDPVERRFFDTLFSHPVGPLALMFATAVSAITINSLVHLGDQDPGYSGREPRQCLDADANGKTLPLDGFLADTAFIHDVLDWSGASNTPLVDKSAHTVDWTFQFGDKIRTLSDGSEILCTVPSTESADGVQFVITRSGKVACEGYQDWAIDHAEEAEAFTALEEYC
jgi:hypothetical protein